MACLPLPRHGDLDTGDQVNAMRTGNGSRFVDAARDVMVG
jgi:hypothetical protein